MAINVANNQSLTAITALPSGVSGGAMTLLATETASSSATLSFTSNIDDTYDEYVFKFYNIHPSAGDQLFQVNFRDGSTAYDATKTTTVFRAFHYEDDSSSGLGYLTGHDLAQSTAFQNIGVEVGSANDDNLSGELHLFSPSNTTFVKHFYSRTNSTYDDVDFSIDYFVAGYCNVTAAIDGVQFKFASGDIDAGVIKLYGIS